MPPNNGLLLPKCPFCFEGVAHGDLERHLFGDCTRDHPRNPPRCTYFHPNGLALLAEVLAEGTPEGGNDNVPELQPEDDASLIVDGNGFEEIGEHELGYDLRDFYYQRWLEDQRARRVARGNQHRISETSRIATANGSSAATNAVAVEERRNVENVPYNGQHEENIENSFVYVCLASETPDTSDEAWADRDVI